LHTTHGKNTPFDVSLFGLYDKKMDITHSHPEKAYTGSKREYSNNTIIGIVYK
jgi:hypothetical protein